MIIISMYLESENQRNSLFPSWSGFNILLLQDHIPARSNTGYLPGVNGNPTQLSIVNVVFFEKSRYCWWTWNWMIFELNDIWTEWYLNLCFFLPRPSKYVGMMSCICKEQLSGLIKAIPAYHFSVLLEYEWNPTRSWNCRIRVTTLGHERQTLQSKCQS